VLSDPQAASVLVAGFFVRDRMGGMKLFGETGSAVLNGGFCGFVVATLICYLITGSNLSHLMGFIIGVPLGMITGGIVAKVRSKK
jgi:hypothetical protein